MKKDKISFDQRDRPDDLEDLDNRLPIVVMIKISKWKVCRVLIDGGCLRNTIFTGALDVMGVPRSKIHPASHSVAVHGFPVSSIGQITLPVTFGTRENFQTEDIVFDVVDAQTAYNAMLGYPALAEFKAAVHYAYRCVKIPGPKGVITVRGY